MTNERDATKEFAQYLKTKDQDYLKNTLTNKLRNVLTEIGILTVWSKWEFVVNEEYVVE